MKLGRLLRQHLRWKLFLSYLIVIVVSSLSLWTAADLVLPSAVESKVATVTPSAGPSSALTTELTQSILGTVADALLIATAVAVVMAVALSSYVSRRVVAPIQQLRDVSRRIADGHYDERVALGAGRPPEELDELDELAVSFDQMAATLEQVERQRRELLADVAHELRTPLAGIKGYMEGLIDGILPSTPETFQKVHHEADRLQRLVADLQELSRVEAGAYALARRPLALSAAMAALVERLKVQFEEKGVALQVELPAGLPAVLADDDRLGQVLLNLVGNALQYTPAGGQVRLTARREGDQVRISVQDTGIGIAPANLPRLFQRFYRVEGSRARTGGGSGLGLTIARHLVEAMGGEITATSAGLGQGSTFSFTLPVA